MKFFGQAKDGGIDNLLRAYVSRPSNPHQKCPDFDPDRANAYIERSLTCASRFHYEEHLSECAACRKNVVALVRLAEAETPASGAAAREVPRFTLLSGAKQMFGALSQPQWAMVAAAVIVAAISVPLLLTRSESQNASVAVTAPSANEQAPSAGAPASPVANPTSENAAPSSFGDATSRQREKSDEKTEVLARTAPAASKPTDAPAGVGGVADVSKKLEVSDAVQPVDEQRKSEGKVAQALAQGGAAPTSQVTKNDSDQGRQQQPEKDSTQQPNESKAARADQQSNEKEKTARAEEATAPPSPPSTSEAARGAMKRSPAKLSLRDSNAGTESVRAEQKEFKGKKFSFRDGAWTDKEFDPNKDLPVVTIIRDSNTYKELISKRAGLRSIMERFTPAERAIIVYKGTVYKLIPQ
jgi:hypothetical protein